MAEYWKSTVCKDAVSLLQASLLAKISLAEILVQALQHVREGYQIRAHPT